MLITFLNYIEKITFIKIIMLIRLCLSKYWLVDNTTINIVTTYYICMSYLFYTLSQIITTYILPNKNNLTSGLIIKIIGLICLYYHDSFNHILISTNLLCISNGLLKYSILYSLRHPSNTTTLINNIYIRPNILLHITIAIVLFNATKIYHYMQPMIMISIIIYTLYLIAYIYHNQITISIPLSKTHNNFVIITIIMIILGVTTYNLIYKIYYLSIMIFTISALNVIINYYKYKKEYILTYIIINTYLICMQMYTHNLINIYHKVFISIILQLIYLIIISFIQYANIYFDAILYKRNIIILILTIIIAPDDTYLRLFIINMIIILINMSIVQHSYNNPKIFNALTNSISINYYILLLSNSNIYQYFNMLKLLIL